MHREEGRIVSMSKRMFIVGSGFTRAVFGDDVPTNADFYLVFASQNRHCGKELSDRYQTNDIEVALTKLDLDINKADAKQDRVSLPTAKDRN